MKHCVSFLHLSRESLLTYALTPASSSKQATLSPRACLVCFFGKSYLSLSDRSCVILSSHKRSVSSKEDSSLLSMSRTAMTSESRNTGTTISLRERLLHAICPGNISMSGTITVSRLIHAAPHTPLPNGILVHATGP